MIRELKSVGDSHSFIIVTHNYEGLVSCMMCINKNICMGNYVSASEHILQIWVLYLDSQRPASTSNLEVKQHRSINATESNLGKLACPFQEPDANHRTKWTTPKGLDDPSAPFAARCDSGKSLEEVTDRIHSYHTSTGHEFLGNNTRKDTTDVVKYSGQAFKPP